MFVSTKGADGAEGTKEDPLKSINEAIELARSKGTKRVYLCASDEEEPFEESVTVPAGVTVYGGLNCAAKWAWESGSKTFLTAPQGEVPLRLNAAEGTVRILDLHVKARPIVIDLNNPDDAEKYGQSSIAAIADGGSGGSDNSSVELVRCTLEADEAASGAPGEAPDSQRATKGSDGNDGNEACTADLVPAALAPENDCGIPDESSDNSVGGAGGNGFPNQAGTGSAGSPGEDANPNGGTRTGTGACGAGLVGRNGADGGAGEHASDKGTLSSDGYTGSPGKDGKPGSPGQGGGGGAGARGGSSVCPRDSAGDGGASGGSGGAGGCGGKGGKGGGPGGSSIALVSIHAELLFKDVHLIASAGGAGGEGAAGQRGGLGGEPGAGGDGPTTLSTGCSGGAGGIGGNGGPGGKGSDGHSLGIAYLGNPPPEQSEGVFTIDAQGGDPTKDFGAP
ncbi:PGRS family protein [Sorangium sp. So ce394]|uniref:PGRS family protein n=1 Tax=Sorangium sp. So ce394 TaxID=3133310 RepID=UPI003F5C6247